MGKELINGTEATQAQVEWATDIVKAFENALSLHREWAIAKIAKAKDKGRMDAATAFQADLQATEEECAEIVKNDSAAYWIKNFVSVINTAPSMFGTLVGQVAYRDLVSKRDRS